MTTPQAAEKVRLAELLAVLALGADLGMNQPMEHAMVQSVLSLRIGGRLSFGHDERAVLYYVSLLAWVGCHIDAYEQAKWFGDDLALKGNFRLLDSVGVRSVGQMMSQIGAGRHGFERAAVVFGFVGGGMRDANDMLANHAYAADRFGQDLGLPEEVRTAVLQTFERWDGKGGPARAKGEDIAIAARIVNLADVLAVYYRVGGIDAAVETARDRRGTQFDPVLVDLVSKDAFLVFAELAETATWDTMVDAEPALGVPLTPERLDQSLEAIGDFIDIKSPYTLGHTRSVTELAVASARGMAWSAGDVAHLRRSALLHDLGRLGVSNAIWDKAGPLSAAEAERVRLHPYLTERMLAMAHALAALGATASQHHERIDGSGYPRNLRGDSMTAAGKLCC